MTRVLLLCHDAVMKMSTMSPVLCDVLVLGAIYLTMK
jgi:hypothetical protein